MAKNIMQFRYYSDGNQKNQPSNISMTSLCNGVIFQQYLPITQLGIQSLPGTKFYVNGDDSIPSTIIGSTGIYELDLEGLSEITQLSFSNESIERISKNESAYLIVDVIYTNEEAD